MHQPVVLTPCIDPGIISVPLYPPRAAFSYQSHPTSMACGACARHVQAPVEFVVFVTM